MRLLYALSVVVGRILAVRPRFVFVDGEPPEQPSLILSNHEGAAGPLIWYFFFEPAKRFWVTHEMTEGIRAVYRYLAYNYFTKKRHLPGILAIPISFVAAPFASAFVKGMDPIPTYTDSRLLGSFRESLQTVRGGRNILLFPEDSSQGYLKRPKKFFGGLVVLGRMLHRGGCDLPMVVAYYCKRRRLVLLRRMEAFSVLWNRFSDQDKLAEYLRLCMLELADRAEQM